MPVNRKYPLTVLLEACDYYVAQKTTADVRIHPDRRRERQRRAGARAGQASRGDSSAKINLIPYNTVEGLEWSRPSRERQENFFAFCAKHGAVATLRREKGHDIAAACGQLRLQTQRAEGESKKVKEISSVIQKTAKDYRKTLRKLA